MSERRLTPLFFLFVWFLNVLVNIADGSQDWRLTILRAATLETERGDHDFRLSWSHYTDTVPTSRERAVTAGIDPRTSSPVVARSTDRATTPPPPPPPSPDWHHHIVWEYIILPQHLTPRADQHLLELRTESYKRTKQSKQQTKVWEGEGLWGAGGNFNRLSIWKIPDPPS